MKISTRILLNHIVIILIAIGAQYYSLKAISMTTETMDNISDNAMPMIFAIEDLRTAGLRMLASTNEYAMIQAEKALMKKGQHLNTIEEIAETALEEEKELIAHGQELYKSALERINEHISHRRHENSVERNHMQDIIEQGRRFKDKCMELVDLKKREVSGAVVLEAKEALEGLEENFLGNIDDLLQNETKWLNRNRQNLHEAESETIQTIIFAGVLFITLIVANAIVVSMSVSRPISDLVNYVNEIGRGNLDVAFSSKTSGEIGTLAKAFNSMTRGIEERTQELRKLSTAIEASPASIIITDPNGTIEYVNPKFVDVTGYAAEEAIGKNPRILQSGRHSQAFYREMWDTITAGKEWTGAFENRRKDGESYWEHTAISPVRNTKDAITHFIAVKEDVTERKQNEQALRERQLNVALEAEVGLYVSRQSKLSEALQFCVESIVKHLDAAFARIWTLNQEEQMLELQASAGLYIHLDGAHNRIPVGKYKIGMIASEKTPHSTNQVVGDPQVRDQEWAKREGMVAFAGYPLLVDDRVEGVMALFARRPLTKTTLDTLGNLARAMALVIMRQRVENALQESENKFRTLYEATGDAVMLMDVKRFIDCNPAALKMFGCESIKEFTTYHPADLSPSLQPDGQDSFELANQKIAETFEKGSNRFEWTHKRKDGTEFPADVLLNVIELDGQPVIDAVVRDITQRKNVEKELVRAKEAAEAAALTKSEFLANMSHEIRTPLNTVLGFLELVLEDPLLPEYQQKHLKTAQLSANNLLRLINDILDISKLESGKLKIENRPFSLIRLMQEIHETMEFKAKEKGLNLRFNISPSASGSFLGDPLRVRQIIINLVSNAIKFTEIGGVSIQIIPSKAKNQFHFMIEDTGIGIPTDVVDQIFQPFTQADASTTRRFGGTGLGTTISRELVELMGGRIWVESEEGKGSTFHFTVNIIPTDQIPETDELFVVPGKPVLPSVRGGFKILLVEDVEANVDLSKIRLKQQGHVVTVARNGLEAIEAFQQEDIDVILMDIQMPEMDGIEATKRIRALEADTDGHMPIIAMTASVMREETENYLKAGMDAIVAKPINFSKLFKAMEVVIQEGVGEMVRKVQENLHPRSEIELPPLDGVDIKKGMQTWQNPEAYAEALLGFSDNYGNIARDLAYFIDSGNMDNAYRITHTLKGVAGNLWVTDVYAIAEKAEKLLKEEGINDLKSLLDSLSTALQKVAISVQPLRKYEQKDIKQKKQMDAERISTIFKELMTAFKQHNPDSVRPILSELSDYFSGRELIAIKEYVAQFDFFSAGDEVIKLSKKLGIDLEVSND